MGNKQRQSLTLQIHILLKNYVKLSTLSYVHGIYHRTHESFSALEGAVGAGPQSKLRGQVGALPGKGCHDLKVGPGCAENICADASCNSRRDIVGKLGGWG